MANHAWYEHSGEPQRCFASFNLIAVDDEGGKVLIPYTYLLGGSNGLEGCMADYTGWDD